MTKPSKVFIDRATKILEQNNIYTCYDNSAIDKETLNNLLQSIASELQAAYHRGIDQMDRCALDM